VKKDSREPVGEPRSRSACHTIVLALAHARAGCPRGEEEAALMGRMGNEVVRPLELVGQSMNALVDGPRD